MLWVDDGTQYTPTGYGQLAKMTRRQDSQCFEQRVLDRVQVNYVGALMRDGGSAIRGRVAEAWKSMPVAE